MRGEGKAIALVAAEQQDWDPVFIARRRIEILGLHPEVDGGRYAAKAIAGAVTYVEADLVADGHDQMAGVVMYRHENEREWREASLSSLGNDRWRAELTLHELGRWRYAVEGWIDAFATWRRGFHLKVEAGIDVSVELLIGSELVAAAAARASGPARQRLDVIARDLQSNAPTHARIDAALDPELARLMMLWPDRSLSTRSPDRVIFVERPKARFSAWYEFFPRSFGPNGKHGSFRDAESHLRYVAGLGFDVVYLPPIHPIGRLHRKGRNNTLDAQPDDPGSPWAIGSSEGGHTAIHPQLGTLADFHHFLAAAKDLGLEVAIDVAFQAAPDHPWVKEHPEWFIQRPDGSIQYAENPPKKYQDIYPINFNSEDWRGLWNELLGVFLYWLEQGVRIFRVDNPHTKSLRFWEWCIAQVKQRDPGAIFLSEAFTRPKLMYALAKLGFTQSYTYFTWRHTKAEFVEYLTELTKPEIAAFFQPNFWPNTPDILPEDLQSGGRAAFLGRFAMAATLSPSYGVYGPAYELLDSIPRPGSEEYIDNEKYQLKQWDLERGDSLRHFMARINRIRKNNPALHDNLSLRFHKTDSDQLLCYSKQTRNRDNTIVIAINLDWHHRHGSRVWLDLEQLGLDWNATYDLNDLIDGSRYTWHGTEGYVELDPHIMPVHVFRLEPRGG